MDGEEQGRVVGRIYQRERDYSFEAFVDVCNADIEKLTKSERGRINRALAELRELQADDYLLSAEIYEKAKFWRELYPEIALTPQALTGVWSSVEEKAKEARRARQVIAPPPVVTAAGCETCRGHKMVFLGTREGNELWAPCPDCNQSADTSFWRVDGTRFTTPDPGQVRQMMTR